MSLEEFFKEIEKIPKKEKVEQIDKNCKSMQDQINALQNF